MREQRIVTFNIDTVYEYFDGVKTDENEAEIATYVLDFMRYAKSLGNVNNVVVSFVPVADPTKYSSNLCVVNKSIGWETDEEMDARIWWTAASWVYVRVPMSGIYAVVTADVYEPTILLNNGEFYGGVKR